MPIMWVEPNKVDALIKNPRIVGGLLGLSIVLNFLGYKELYLENFPSVLLTDPEGLTEVIINKGEHYSLLPLEPLLDYVPFVRKIGHVEPGVHDEKNHYFWPLSWEPRVPKISKICKPGLYEISNDLFVGIPALKPWSSISLHGCMTSKLEKEESSLVKQISPLKFLDLEAVSFIKVNNDLIISEDLNVIASKNNSLTVMNKLREITLDLKCYDYYIEVLHPGGWYKLHINKDVVLKGVSFVIECLKEKLFISSPKGLELKAIPARIHLNGFGNEVVIGKGGHSRAVKSLIELVSDAIAIDEDINIGMPRGEAVGIADLSNPNFFRTLIWNPTEYNNMFEVRLRIPMKKVSLSDPLGSEDLIVERGLVKVPLPPFWIACLEMIPRSFSSKRLLND